MPLPPEDIPTGLAADEYEKLHVRYLLMGRVDKAIQAMQLRDGASRKADTGRGSTQTDQEKAAYELGQTMALSFMKLLTQPHKQKAPSPAENESKLVESLMKGTEDLLGVDARAQVNEISKKLGVLIQSSAAALAPSPPQDVPKGLTAKEYYHLGLQYKAVGWTEQARDALTYSFELDSNGEIGRRAQRFMRTKIPRHPVPMVAVQMNVQGFNQMASGQELEAKATFERLIHNYPDFEWPYGNLGSLYIKLGNFETAKTTLNQALEINPFYVNGRLHLCRAQILTGEFESARKNLEKVREIDPEERLEQLEETLKKVQGWDL